MPNISTSQNLMDQVVLDLESKLYDKLNDHNIVNHLLLVATSMISYYGENYKFCVYDVLLNTNYIIDNYSDFNFTHTIRDVLSKNVYEYRRNYVMSICNIEKDTNMENLNAYRAMYSLCITNRYVNNIDMLECLMRELNKIFLSKNKTFRYIDNHVTLRNGISLTNLKDSNIEEKKTINDIISYLQTEDLLKITKKLVYTGNNKDLNKLLNDIKAYDMDNMVLDCCLPLVNLFRPLFDLEYVKKLLNINMFEGNIDNISDEFDSILGIGAFDKMSKKLDKLYEDFYNGYLGYNVSEYNISKDYVAIRDNFIKKYIKKKYA